MYLNLLIVKVFYFVSFFSGFVIFLICGWIVCMCFYIDFEIFYGILLKKFFFIFVDFFDINYFYFVFLNKLMMNLFNWIVRLRFSLYIKVWEGGKGMI